MDCSRDEILNETTEREKGQGHGQDSERIYSNSMEVELITVHREALRFPW
jgi:hypothetical protein